MGDEQRPERERAAAKGLRRQRHEQHGRTDRDGFERHIQIALCAIAAPVDQKISQPARLLAPVGPQRLRVLRRHDAGADVTDRDPALDQPLCELIIRPGWRGEVQPADAVKSLAAA